MASTYLDPNDIFTASNPGHIYGADGNEQINIVATSRGVIVDQNIERVDFGGDISAYTFQQAGNQLKVFINGELMATIPVQGDANGTQVVFEDGLADVKLVNGVMTFGGTTVPANAAGPVAPATIDASVDTNVTTGPSGGSGGGGTTPTADAPIILTTHVDAVDDEEHVLDRGTDDETTVEPSETEAVMTTDGNDTITAEEGTLQTGDSIVDASTEDNDSLDAKMNGDLGTADNGTNSDPSDGPTITNIENITLHDEQKAEVYNLGNVSGAVNVNIDSKQSELFNSDNDVPTLEVRNVDGTKIKNIVLIDNTKGLTISEMSNEANVILKDDITSLSLDAKDGSDTEKASVELKGADFTLGLTDDNDSLSTVNDGGSSVACNNK